jgi:hypothetical protein
MRSAVADDRFIYGVLADGGLKDVGKMDYVDRFTEFEAGSPIKSSKFGENEDGSPAAAFFFQASSRRHSAPVFLF